MSTNLIIKKAALAYIGAVAFAYEKSKEAFDFCIEKGAKTLDEARPKGEELIAKVKEAAKTRIIHGSGEEKIGTILDSLTDDEREMLKEKLGAPGCNASECGCEDCE
ncbi:MAG TPA: hypothetical protein PLT66_02170 [Bacillota bacterium]|nr:hypothetical protein [Bacillota bacterium]